MFPPKLIKWFVFIEGPNHVIAEGPDIINDLIAFKSSAFREPDDIQPVSSPSLTIAWGCKQSVDQVCIGQFADLSLSTSFLAAGGQKVCPLLGCGWQTGQIIGRSSQQRGRARR